MCVDQCDTYMQEVQEDFFFYKKRVSLPNDIPVQHRRETEVRSKPFVT